jgi:hypothetical protein
MAAKKVSEPKQSFTYRAKPSIVKKAKRKCKKQNITLSSKIESYLIELNSSEADLIIQGDLS